MNLPPNPQDDLRAEFMVTSRRQAVMRVVLMYALFAAGYIIFSDRLLLWLFSDPEAIALASTAKGFIFVGVTSLLLYVLVNRMLASELDTMRELSAAEA